MDINTYANDLLFDFVDAFHRVLSARLRDAFGADWINKGVRKHFAKDVFARTEQMLSSPMRVVDVDREPGDLYGVEHLGNIIDGNWSLFKEAFGNRSRTQVYLSEVAELRHNLAHRRKSHHVRRNDLMRFAENARMLLAALEAPESEQFAGIVDSLLQGGAPWGGAVAGDLPPHDEIYDQWVGRTDLLRSLTDWFVGDTRQMMIWGYGGAGKSSLAYEFARELQEAPPVGLEAVVWVTAKQTEYIAGAAREHAPDFTDVSSFCNAVFMALYGRVSDANPEALIKELSSTNCLIVIDDLDTILGDQETAQFLLFDMRECKSKILYTSRHQIPGLQYKEVPPFDDEELKTFVTIRAGEYGANVNECLKRIQGIRSVTDGYPLFVDDLVRFSRLVGIDDAVAQWSQRKGDAARQYALRRQLESLESGGVSGDALIAVAVAGRDLVMTEIGTVAGLTDEDAQQGVADLLNWHLIHQVVHEGGSTPAYSMNANTRRLTLKTFAGSPRLRGSEAALRALTGERVPEAKRRAIAATISRAQEIFRAQGVEPAAALLKQGMTGELAEDSDLYGALGWLYSRDWAAYADLAREAFRTAHRLGALKVDPYYHWVQIERQTAEQAVGIVADRDLLGLWRSAVEVAQLGIERCGPSDVLCQLAGYLSSREAYTHQRLNEFVAAQGAYRTAAEWYKAALVAPAWGQRVVRRATVYRGLALAYEELNDMDGLVQTLRDWGGLAGSDRVYIAEASRLKWRFPELVSRLPRLEGTDVS